MLHLKFGRILYFLFLFALYEMGDTKQATGTSNPVIVLPPLKCPRSRKREKTNGRKLKLTRRMYLRKKNNHDCTPCIFLAKTRRLDG